jgi:hypothetical protein
MGLIMRLTVHRHEKESDIFEDVVRIHTSHRQINGQTIYAGDICRVEANEKCVRAVARNLPASESEFIEIDYAMMKRLAVAVGEQVEFKISKANRWDKFIWAWQATNPVNQIAAKLGIISVVLGMLSLILAVWSIYLTFPKMK